jgi:hypothetical protein
MMRSGQALVSALALLLAAGCNLGDTVPLSGITPQGLGGAGAGELSFSNVREVTGLSVEEKDDNPSLSEDLLLICFTSLREGGTGDSDIWCASRESADEPFESPVEAAPANSESFETSSALSPDGLTLWFGSRRDGGQGEVDIWKSTRKRRQDPWTTPHLEPTLNSPEDDIPRPLGMGGTVMPLGSRRIDNSYFTYFSQFDPAGSTFTTPELAPALAEGDSSPGDCFLTDDGLTLLFAQVDAGNDPTADLYFMTRATITDEFSGKMEISGVNTPANERDPWLSRDGKTLFFSSDREGKEFDIYEAELK